MTASIYRRIGEGARGVPVHAVYCDACPASGVPGAGWYMVEGFGLAPGGEKPRHYLCPACGPILEAEDLARALEPLEPLDVEALDVQIDARARARTRAGWSP